MIVFAIKEAINYTKEKIKLLLQSIYMNSLTSTNNKKCTLKEGISLIMKHVDNIITNSLTFIFFKVILW